MRSANQNHIKQRNLFFELSALPGKSSVPLFTLPEDTKPRRINHMAKFKPFHEFHKPLIGFTPETFLDYVETVIPKDHLYIDGTKLKGNASAKRTKDRAGFEKWLSEIEDEIAKILKEGEAIDNQEDESCKIDPEQEALKERLSDRKYLKSKIEEALEIMKEEEKEKINLTDRDAKTLNMIRQVIVMYVRKGSG
ncbi:MAG TPA: hypothetical protein VI727_09150 [Candidatus Brocadiaceae bacterium]|nr:hypothetical protein [Candidatus Brocadiaceae bacterium]